MDYSTLKVSYLKVRHVQNIYLDAYFEVWSKFLNPSLLWSQLTPGCITTYPGGGVGCNNGTLFLLCIDHAACQV